jgi:hypothetical protein
MLLEWALCLFVFLQRSHLLESLISFWKDIPGGLIATLQTPQSRGRKRQLGTKLLH